MLIGLFYPSLIGQSSEGYKRELTVHVLKKLSHTHRVRTQYPPTLIPTMNFLTVLMICTASLQYLHAANLLDKSGYSSDMNVYDSSGSELDEAFFNNTEACTDDEAEAELEDISFTTDSDDSDNEYLEN